MQLSLPWRSGQAKPFGSIPRINWNHPITRGMVFYGYDSPSGPIDLVTGVTPSRVGSPNPSFSTSQFGTGQKYASGGGVWVFPVLPRVNSIFTSKLYSAACAWFITSLPSLAFTVPFGVNEATDVSDCSFIWNSNDTSNMQWSVNNTNPVPFTANTVNVYHSMVGANTGATAQQVYYDGVAKTTTALTAGFTTTLGQVCFAALEPALGGTFPGNGIVGFVYYGIIWDRTVTANEAALLHNDPYCFLLYPEDDIFATLVGATAAPVAGPVLGILGMAASECS